MQKSCNVGISRTLNNEVVRLLRGCASQKEPLLLNQHLTYIANFQDKNQLAQSVNTKLVRKPKPKLLSEIGNQKPFRFQPKKQLSAITEQILFGTAA